MMAVALVAVGAQADSFGSGGNAFTLDFVNIGYAGNVGDTANTVNGINPGAVDYDFRIGKFEVTLDQFAKAHAASGNTIGDGDEGYWNDGTRTVGTGGPASYVSWNEAARFANWLSSGDANTGVYSFSGGLVSGIDRSYRNDSDLAYVLPSEDEWYKAAYYKPVDDGSYSLYASGLDTVPTHGTASGWNYYNGGYVNGSPNYMWKTGDGGTEQNGTFDMMGNIWEWNESAFDGSTNNMAASRVFRGGSAFSLESNLRSSARNSNRASGSRYDSRVWRWHAVYSQKVEAIIPLPF
jgi:formylglycine-generating enzyme required for sulfatase activity